MPRGRAPPACNDPRVTLHRAAVLFVALAACSAAKATSADRVPKFATLDDAPPSTVEALDLDRFVGRWYVVVSNFEFWARRERSDPSFHYERIPDPKVVKLADRVDYRQRGRQKDFVGVDLQDPSRAGHFHWQGDGLLYGVKNQWFVVKVDEEYRWAVIYFSKSSFGTGAGVEIISRTPTLAPADRVEALAFITADPFLSKRANGLFDPPHGEARTPGK
jgi:lipocalin